MKLISLLIASLCLFASCNSQKEEPINQNPSFSFGSPLSTNRSLSPQEQSLGNQICKLLRDKREYFETLEDNRWELEFNGNERLCGNVDVPQTRYLARLRVPSRGPMTFDSRFRRYIGEVLTDRDGFMSHFCDDLLGGGNTTIIKEVGGKKIQLSLGSSGNFLIAQAGWYYPDETGVFKPYLLDKVTIHTQASTNNRRYYGVVKGRAQHRPCDNNTVRYLIQTLR